MAKKKKKGRYYNDYERYSGRMESGTMVGGKESIANLPQEVVMKAYPRVPYGMPDQKLIDTLEGIDYQMSQDNKRQKSGRWPEKY